ncbi:HD domain-containing protein [Paraphaeosphaeria sporulosa]
MPSSLKRFPSRFATFVKRPPSLWASTLPASHDATHTPTPSLPGGYATSSEARNCLLFNMDKLDIPPRHRDLFLAVNKLVRDYMYGPRYDPSHDYEHIQRVVKNTYELYTAEKAAGRLPQDLDVTTMYLAAMMHDVGETKYLEKGRTQEDVVVEKMLKCGASPALATAVATIALNVSYTREKSAHDQTLIHAIITAHPELAFVQDADRLDALGPSGQARCFVFGGANEGRRAQSIHTGVQLHHKRFRWYVGMMKTRAGKERAEKGWSWMTGFAQEWGVDTDVGCVL